MSVSPDNIFASIPSDLNEEMFTVLAESSSVKVQRIVSKGHSSPPFYWYDQADNEWVIVLQGEARIEFAEEPEIHLLPGDHLTIPAHVKHRVSWTAPDIETVWLAVHFI